MKGHGMTGYDVLADVVCSSFRDRGMGDLVQRPRAVIVAEVYAVYGADCPASVRVGIADQIQKWKDHPCDAS